MTDAEIIKELREIAATIEADSVSANYAKLSAEALKDIAEWLGAFTVFHGRTIRPPWPSCN